MESTNGNLLPLLYGRLGGRWKRGGEGEITEGGNYLGAQAISHWESRLDTTASIIQMSPVNERDPNKSPLNPLEENWNISLHKILLLFNCSLGCIGSTQRRNCISFKSRSHKYPQMLIDMINWCWIQRLYAPTVLSSSSWHHTAPGQTHRLRRSDLQLLLILNKFLQVFAVCHTFSSSSSPAILPYILCSFRVALLKYLLCQDAHQKKPGPCRPHRLFSFTLFSKRSITK